MKLVDAINRAADRLDTFSDAEIAAMRSTPRALAAQAANRVKAQAAAKRLDAKYAKRRDNAVAANTFVVGQSVQSVRRMGADFMVATVTAVNGSTITLDNGKTFAASAFVAK